MPKGQKFTRKEKIVQIKHQSKDVHIKKLNALSKTTKKIVAETAAKQGNKWRDHCYGAEQIENITSYINKIDLTIIDDVDAVTIFNMLYIEVPKRLDRYMEIYFKHHDSYNAAGRSINKVNLSYLDGLLKFQLSESYRSVYKDNRVEFKPSEVFFREDLVVKRNPKVFPDIKAEDYYVKNAIAEVRKLWTAAMTKNNTIEDEFFLEQVAVTYVPESYSLYSNFLTSSSTVRRKASKAFVEQMDMIVDQLNVILSRKVEEEMGAMKVQTMFLRNILKSKDTSSSLKLRK